MVVKNFSINENSFEKSEKQSQHMRTSKTGKVFSAGSGSKKEAEKTETKRKREPMDYISAYLDISIEEGKEQEEKFKKDFESNPLYATEWLDSRIDAIAKKQECQQLKSYLNSGKINIDNLEKVLREDFISSARSRSKSTSSTTNLVENAKRVAKAELYEYISDIIQNA